MNSRCSSSFHTLSVIFHILYHSFSVKYVHGYISQRGFIAIVSIQHQHLQALSVVSIIIFQDKFLNFCSQSSSNFHRLFVAALHSRSTGLIISSILSLL